MATFHTSLRVLCRSKGESSVAAAAYRAGTKLRDAKLGLTQDYSRRHGVVEVEVIAPPDAPPWATDIHALWDAVEARETRINARLARELIVALPHELSEAARSTLARQVARVLVDRYGVAVQLAIHAPDKGGDDRNHHVHLLFTTRSITAAGWGPKTRVLDEPKTGPGEVTWLREKVAELTNRFLEAAGATDRVDHRSLRAQAKEAEAQGDFERAARLTRVPTRHEGRAATAAARRGERVRLVLENQEKQRLHREALDGFMRKVRLHSRPVQRVMRQGHPALGLMPAATASPPTPRRVRVQPAGPGAAILEAQARQLDADRRRSGKTARMYLEGLRKTMEEGRRSLDAYVKLVGRKHALDAWLRRCEDRQAWELFRQSLEAHRALRATRVWNSKQLSRWQQATAKREQQQRDCDAHDTARPKRWQLTQKATWQRERQSHWRRLRRAIAAEQAAREDSEAAKAHTRAETLRLRAELRTFEVGLHQAAQRSLTKTQDEQVPSATVPPSQAAPTPPNASAGPR